MRLPIISVSLLALIAPAAYAQQAPKPAVPQPGASGTTPSAQTDVAEYLVFFDWNKATLTPEAREVIATAAEEYKRTGTAKIVATGYTDLSGTPQYNLKLSERRAESVKTELVRLGVPAGVITTIGMGEADPLVPTKDGVREAQNRRVVIQTSRPPKAAEAPKPAPAPAPTAAAPPPPPPPPPLKWEASLGPWFGYNLKETDAGRNQKSSDLVGPDLRVDYDLTPTWSVYGDLAAFNTVGTASDNGWGVRPAVGFAHQWNLGAWHPSIGPKVGYIAGKGVEDGLTVGPELGLKYDIARNLFLYGRAAYDRDFRNDFDQGIINGGIGVGARW